jgi:hypothetical protein
MGMCPSMNAMRMKQYFLSINGNLPFMNRIIPFVNRIVPFDFGHRQIDENRIDHARDDVRNIIL